MKLKATFPTRRDGTFGRVGELKIDNDGFVDVADKLEAERLISTGNFVPADGKQVSADSKQASKYDAMERDELAALVEKATGHKPHHKLGNAKLIEIILSEEQDCKADED